MQIYNCLLDVEMSLAITHKIHTNKTTPRIIYIGNIML